MSTAQEPEAPPSGAGRGQPGASDGRSAQGAQGQAQQRSGEDDQSGGTGAAPKPAPDQAEGRSAVEWISLAVSVVILVGLIGLVTYEHFSRGTAPAAIEVQPHLADVRRNADAYYLPVEVANRGDLTARDVRIRLSLTPSGGEPQSSELLIDFLAGGATAHGTAVFRSDPSRGELRIDVLSYLDPS